MQCHLTHLYMRPLTIVLVGDVSDMFCGGRLRLERTAVDVEAGVGYERPLLSLLTRAATSIDNGAFNWLARVMDVVAHVRGKCPAFPS